MRLGLLGGTFDPVHLGHLIVAQAVAELLPLDRVLFVPAGQPWMKQGQPLSAKHHRRAMVELAVGGNPRFGVCTLELDRLGLTYTVDTLEQLRAERGPGDEFFFIMGVDTVEGFPSWKDPGRVLQVATVVVVPRPGRETGVVGTVERDIPGAVGRLVLAKTPLVEISASDIRQRVAGGLPIRHLVPEAVAAYIEEHGLYQEGTREPRQPGRGRKGRGMSEANTQTAEQEILDCALGEGALRYGKFTLSSGEESAFYFDGRVLTLSPRGANLVARALLPHVRAAGAEAIGGPTLGADPMVSAVAMLSGQDEGKPIPAFIVRKETKGHGTGKMVEGPLAPKSKVAIVDDTCTTGGSLFHAIRAAEQEECTVVLVAVILDRREGGSERIRNEGYPFLSLLEVDSQGQIKPTSG